MADNLVNVICMKWGTKYNGPYVNNLFSMVGRNLTLPHRFVCFTDDSEGFAAGIESFPLPFNDLSGHKVASAWNKLAVFSPQLGDLKGPTLFLDLDLIIIDNIDCFFEYQRGAFVIIHDWSHLHEIVGNSSVFRFQVGEHTDVLEYFLAHMDEVKAKYGNEQTYLSNKMHQTGKLNYWPETWCRSFKRHCLPPIPINWFKAPTLPREGKIIVFHGDPNPGEAIQGKWSKGKWTRLRRIRPTPWIVDYWR